MTTYEYTGVVEEVFETKAVGANGFTKRDIVVGNDVDSPNRYPNPVLFTFKKLNTSMLDGVNKGERVKITFTIDGRRWDGPNGVRYFTDLTGWKIEKLAVAAAGTAVPEPVTVPEAPIADPAGTDTENLPF